MRIGTSVGCPPFRYTNRPRQSMRRLNRKARAHGFASHKAFAAHMVAMLNLEQVKG